MLNLRDTKEITLRPYQLDAVEGLRDGLREGLKRQILCAPTGAGKTVLAAHLLKQADSLDNYALFLVDRVALVNQTSETLDEYGVNHGIVQGINRRWAPRENVQVCSVQTLARRKLPRAPKLIIYDEAHCQYAATLKFIADHPDAVAVGLTATPFTAGMADHWEGMVNVTTTRKLITDGFLMEPKIYIARSPDESEYGRNKFGEFSDEDAASAGIKIVGDVVAEWIAKTTEHFGGPAKTIVFSPTVEHGRELCAAFSAAGFNFQQISYLDRDDNERAEKIAEFRRPDSLIHGLVSCGVLTKGFDVPDVLVGISCKPYRKSLSSHIQEIGRIMRTHPDKTKCLWLDHCGNFQRFAVDMYDVWDHGAGELSSATKRDSVAREREVKTREPLKCAECGGGMRGNTCTACGWERPARSEIQSVAGELREFDPSALGLEPRGGLRADCLKRPKDIWLAALNYCAAHTRQGEDHARRWAYGVFRGVYPGAKLPNGWYGARIPASVDQAAYGLVERETARFRKKSPPRRPSPSNDNARASAAA